MQHMKLAEAYKQIGLGYVNLGEALLHDAPAAPAENSTLAEASPKGTRKTKKEPAAETTTPVLTTPVAAAEPEKPAGPTIEQVREKFVAFADEAKTPNGGLEKAKALLAQYGATKLGALDAKHYPAFLASITAASEAADDITA